MTLRGANPSSGMIWMEILIVLAVAGFITVAGLRGIGLFIEQLGASRLQQGRLLELSQFRESFQRAWDQRASHSFRETPWLEVEGRRAGDSVELETLRVHFYSSNGKALVWELVNDTGAWIVSETGMEDSKGTGYRRALSYKGSIRIEISSLSWPPGNVPEKIVWGFPDSVEGRMKVGFAIHRLW